MTYEKALILLALAIGIVGIPAVFWLYCLKVAWMNKAFELQAELNELKELDQEEVRDMMAALEGQRAKLELLAAGNAEPAQ